MLPYFTDEYIDVRIPIAGKIRTLRSELTYYSRAADTWVIVSIGFKTDLGSIPQALQGIFPKDGEALFGYILHDWLYKTGSQTRSMSDDMLEEAMKHLGVNWWRRKAVRNGLRVGGWVSWNRHRSNDER